jgi:hypothetical protein
VYPQVPDGYKAAFGYVRDDPAESLEVHPRYSAEGSKGTTIAVIFAADDEHRISPVAVGVASCGPNDQFSRRIGRTAALGRALKQMRGDEPAAEHDDQAALEHVGTPDQPDNAQESASAEGLVG